MRTHRSARWTSGGYAWLAAGLVLLVAVAYVHSPYFAATGLAFLAFAPLLDRLKRRHLLTRLVAATGLFGVFLGAGIFLGGSMTQEHPYVTWNQSLHSTISWPFDYSSQAVYSLARTVLPDHPLTFSALYAALILVWIVLSVLLLWLLDSSPYLRRFTFPMAWRWFAPYLFCVGFVFLCYAGGPVYRSSLSFEMRKSLVYVLFNVVTVWLVVWHGWLLLRESGRRFRAGVYAVLNLQVFFEVSFYAGLMLTHGMF